MTPIHILFAKMVVKMFHISLKYTFTTCFNLTGPSSGNILFSRNCTAHIVTRTLRFAVVYLFLVLYDIPFSYFLYCGCSVHQPAHDQEAVNPVVHRAATTFGFHKVLGTS
jgi:hypothetical protein